MAASCGLAVVLHRAAADPTFPRGAVLAVFAVGVLAWGVSVGWLERRGGRQIGRRNDPSSDQPGAAALGRAILLAALLLRLPLLFAAPTLSNDVWRYLWDGRVVASGANPYVLAPDAAELTPLRDDLWQRLDHRGVATVYPPLSLAAFSISAASPWPLLTWKGLLTAAELAGCALLLALARRRGTPLARVAWYAWNPLVALEVAGMGHVDGLAVAPMVAAVLWLTARRTEVAGEIHDDGLRPRLSALAAAAGVLVKLGPLVALPLWARFSADVRAGAGDGMGAGRWRRGTRYLGIAVAVSAAGLLPVLIATGGVPPGLTTYGVSWEFNGPLYEPLWRLLDVAGADHAAARAADAAKAATGWHDGINRAYPFLYPQFLAKLLLAAAAAWVVACVSLGRGLTGRRLGVGNGPPAPGLAGEDAASATGRLFGGLLLCSATVYPWYLLWVLPWAALDRHRPWLLASALAPVVYLATAGAGEAATAAGEPDLFPGLWLAAWGLPAVIALTGAVRRRRSP